MILSSDNNDALNRAIAHENSSSSRIGLLENKMKKLEDVGVLIARILMPVLFITAGWGKISGYAGTQQYMEAMGVPGFLLPLTILLEFRRRSGDSAGVPYPHHCAFHRWFYVADGIDLP